MSRPVRLGDRYLTSSEAGRILNVSAKCVARWCQEGRIGHIKTLGGHNRLSEREVRALAEQLQQPATTDWRRAQ